MFKGMIRKIMNLAVSLRSGFCCVALLYNSNSVHQLQTPNYKQQTYYGS